MIISHKYQFIFVKTTKTAGTSIETYLSPYCGKADVFTPIFPVEPGHIPRNFGSPVPNNLASLSMDEFRQLQTHTTYRNHMPATQIRDRVEGGVWDSYYSFCVERNPWEKAVSHYAMLLKREQFEASFEQYCLEKRCPSDASKWLSPGSKEILVDRVVRYERLHEELAELFGRLGIPFENGLNVRAKSGYRNTQTDFRKYYTNNAMIESVASVCHREIELLGYRFS